MKRGVLKDDSMELGCLDGEKRQKSESVQEMLTWSQKSESEKRERSRAVSDNKRVEEG